MKNVLILGNSAKAAVHEAVCQIEPWLARRAHVRVDLEMAGPAAPGEVDFAVVLGGDGSVLRAARALAHHHIPLLGVNVGHFGFLTETTLPDLEDVLEKVLAGHYVLAERMMLDCALERDGRDVLVTLGLNEAVVSRTALSRLITLDFEVDGEQVTTYRADGIIVATPVGSTAHSLAAGGPLLYPEFDALVVTPICPHTLSNRPLVLPGTSVVTMTVGDGAEAPALTVDGQVNRRLATGDRVRVRRADVSLRLIRTGRRTFFETLRNKLDWRGQPRYVRDNI